MSNLEIIKLLASASIAYEKNMQIIKEKSLESKEIRDLYAHLFEVEGTYNHVLLSRLADSGIDVNNINGIEDIKEILEEMEVAE